MSRAHARALVSALLFVPAFALVAHADAPTSTRAEFPDRRWDGVTATDGALAGAGLATDPGSSYYGNPALALVGPRGLRVSGLLALPQRDDLRASTTDFQDATGFPALGEAGVRLRVKGLGVSAYFAQPSYQHEETRFVGVDPQTGTVTDPFLRENHSTSAARYGGLALAARLANGVVLGVAGEAVDLVSDFESTPIEPAGSLAESLDVDRRKFALGGAVGLSYTSHGLLGVGAAYHRAAGVTYDNGGSDDAPSLLVGGVRVGRTAGSAGYAGVRLLGARTVDLGEAGGATYTAPSRKEYALGYAYDAPAGGWFFRIGGGASPRPAGGDLKLSRFGVALGLATEQGRVSLGYDHTGESRAAGGRPSSTNRALLTVEVLK